MIRIPAASYVGLAGALAALLLSAGCGWHLRGVRALPDEMSRTYIQAPINANQLVRYIERDLNAAGVQVVDRSADDAAVLTVRPSSGRRTLSIGPDGKAREYEVYYTVRFGVRKPGSAFKIPEQQITLSRDFVYDPLDALAVNQEQELLVDSLERDLARLVIQRLSAAGDDETDTSTQPRSNPPGGRTSEVPGEVESTDGKKPPAAAD